MRIPTTFPAAAISTFVFLTQLRLTTATPVALEEGTLEKRCDNPCGYNDWLCCGSGQTCSTNSNNEAVCLDGGSGEGGGGGGGGGQFQYYTTTYVTTETDVSTITSVWSSHIAAATSSGSCQPSLGETPCGNDCCDASSVCVENQCVVGSSSEVGTATATATGTEAPTPPVRGTSNGFTTVTETSAPTTTQGFLAPVATNGSTVIGVHASSGEGLSGGAIAGIVVGVIAGVFLLLLVCACLCCRGAIDGLLALFGLGPRRRRKETTTYVDRYSHHSHGNRPEGRTWFGTRPSRPEGSEKKSGWSTWATIGIILGALALCLGLKRHKDHEEKSDYSYPTSYSYYSDYYTSTSMYPSSPTWKQLANCVAGSASSDRRTRRTRDTRRSRSSRPRR